MSESEREKRRKDEESRSLSSSIRRSRGEEQDGSSETPKVEVVLKKDEPGTKEVSAGASVQAPTMDRFSGKLPKKKAAVVAAPGQHAHDANQPSPLIAEAGAKEILKRFEPVPSETRQPKLRVKSPRDEKRVAKRARIE